MQNFPYICNVLREKSEDGGVFTLSLQRIWKIQNKVDNVKICPLLVYIQKDKTSAIIHPAWVCIIVHSLRFSRTGCR